MAMVIFALPVTPDIRNQNKHRRDVDVQKERVKVKCVYMPNENPYATFYSMAVVLFVLSVTVYKILPINMCMTLIIEMSNINCKYTSACMTFYVMVLVIYAFSVTVYEIFALKCARA